MYKKTIYLLNIDDYSSDITTITYPLIFKYAERIGADVHLINERRYPDWPVVYEKLQIGQIAKQNGSDWNIYIDSDALVHPDTIDFTELVSKDTVLHNGSDMGLIRWRYDSYFRRNGRNIGSCNWFAMASDWCLDLWTPLDITLEEALTNIRPTVEEMNSGVIDAAHLIDDYTLSRNIARFGLKFNTILQLALDNGLAAVHPASGDYNGRAFFYHEYTIPAEEKIDKMVRKVLPAWGLLDWPDDPREVDEVPPQHRQSWLNERSNV